MFLVHFGRWSALVLLLALPVLARDDGTSLLEARRGHETRLTAEARDGSPLPSPPAGLFSLVAYPTELGAMSAYVSVPTDTGRKHPAIVWLVGGLPAGGAGSFVWEETDPVDEQSARAYREEGLVMMYPALRGAAGNPGRQECFFGEVDDVLAALAYLGTLDFVDAERVYLGGHSTGGTLALLVAEATDGFKAVVAFGPVTDPARYGADNLTYDVNDREERRLRAPVEFLDAIRVPTFVIEGEYGNRDDLVALAEAGRNPHLRCFTVEGAGHFEVLAPLNRLIARRLASLPARDEPELEAGELQAAFDAAVVERLRDEDLATLRSLAGAGVPFDRPVDVNHYLFAWDEDALEAAVGAARSAGLDAGGIQAQVDDEGETYYVTVVWKPLELADENAVFALTLTVYNIARDTGAEYGGWDAEQD